jgi:hypothetical protein
MMVKPNTNKAVPVYFVRNFIFEKANLRLY